jgi:hypothetical protein
LNATVVGTVTANIGTTNGLALDTSVNGILVAQGSTTSGEKGPLIQGAVTTAAPTYTTAQTSPLSLTTAGALRVDGSGATQPVSGTVTANAGTGNFTVVQSTASNLNATVQGTTAAGSGSATNLVTVQGNASGTPIPVTGSVVVDKSSTGTITNPTGSTSSFTVLAANSNRIGFSIYNGTNKVLYIAMAATATTSAYTLQVAIGGFYESNITYTGIITGIFATNPTGPIGVTEYSP